MLGSMTSVIVCGTARQLVEPDRATVSLGLTVVAKDAAGALDDVARRSNELTSVLDALDIPASRRTTDGVAVAEEWEWRKDTNTLVGYRATTGVTVVLADLGSIPPLLRAAVGSAGAQIRALNWEVDDENPVRYELLGGAARDAHRRATAYAEALGLRLGAVELVSESPISAGAPDDSLRPQPMQTMARGGGAEVVVHAGQVALTSEVHVRFSLLP